jgi:hypothetical protein
MKDPTTVGAVTSAATLFILSVWKSHLLRWLAICIGAAALAWVLGSEGCALASQSMVERHGAQHANKMKTARDGFKAAETEWRRDL